MMLHVVVMKVGHLITHVKYIQLSLTRFSTGLLKFIAAGIIIFKTTYKIK